MQIHYDAVEFRPNTSEKLLAAGGDSEEIQTDIGDGGGPVSNTEMVSFQGEELSDEDGPKSSEFMDYNLEVQQPVIYTKDNSSDHFPKSLLRKTKTKRKGKTSIKTTRSSNQEPKECDVKGSNQVEFKRDVIGKEMKRCSLSLEPESETGANRLLTFDPSQHFRRIEEVVVVHAPPPEWNRSQKATENCKSNAEVLENIPDEEEQLHEVDGSAMVDEEHDSGETSQDSENDRTGSAQNTDGFAAQAAEDRGPIVDIEQVAVQGAQEVDNNDNNDDSSEGAATHNGYAGIAYDSGYRSAESAIFNQTFSYFRAIVMILGYNNAGKTCLSDTLLEFPFRDPKNPSNARETHSDELEDLSNCKVTCIHAHAAGQHWTQLDESFGEALEKDLETRLTDAKAMDNGRHGGKELVMRLKILDMDGEFPFYQTHPMLMSESMIYLVVMDITKKLDEILSESTLAKIWKGKIDYPNTPKKFLDHWLTSICSFLNEHDLPNQHRRTKSVVLVLTHTDQLDPGTRNEQIKKFKQEVLTHVKKQYAGKYIVKTIIALSNTDRDICRDELRTSKDTILELAESKATFGVIKPCTWLKFEADIMKQCEVFDRNYMTVGEMAHFSGQAGMSREQFKEFLTLHKEVGSLHFMDDESDDSLIVMDPQFLVDAFTSIIDLWIKRRTSQLSLTHQTPLETDLEDGIFSLGSLGLIWKDLDDMVVETLASFLKSSRLFISQIQKDEQGNIFPEKYIVPCLQPPLAEPENDVQETLTPKTLVYFFHTAQEKRMIMNSGFLPRGFLSLLVASLMEEKENAGVWENTHLFCNGASFRTGIHGDIDLTMSTDAATVIKLDVLTSHDSQIDNVSAEISTARNIFEDQIKQLLQNQFPNVCCSVCVSPCHNNKEINRSSYSCLSILGSLGQVGTKHLWSA